MAFKKEIKVNCFLQIGFRVNKTQQTINNPWFEVLTVYDAFCMI